MILFTQLEHLTSWIKSTNVDESTVYTYVNFTFIGLKTSTTLNKDLQVGTSESTQRHGENSSNGKYMLINIHTNCLSSLVA